MAERLAATGFVVALPDLFHRAGDVFEVLSRDAPFASLGDAAVRGVWMKRFFQSATNPAHIAVDLAAVLAHLDGDPDVKGAGREGGNGVVVGVTGYCMGGNVALRAAALFPERIVAAASFHGGFLASTAPDSPHLGAPRIQALVYVAAAEDDASFPIEQRDRLIAALADAGVDHVVEGYAARHGFAVPDSPTFDDAASERHFDALVKMLSSTLSA